MSAPSASSAALLETARARVESVLGDAAGVPELLDAHQMVASVLTAALGELDDWPEVGELHRLCRALVEQQLAPRCSALERVHEAIERLGSLGPATEIVDHGAAEAGGAVDLDRVLLSRVDDGLLVAQGIFSSSDQQDALARLARLQEAPIQLEYPLLEGEIMRRRRPLLVAGSDVDARGRQAHGELMGWNAYVAAPILLGGRVVGFLHGDRAAHRPPVGPVERDALWIFGQGFAQVFERAVLRRRLRIQRQEMRQVASWADARTSDLTDSAIDLGAGEAPVDGDAPATPAPTGERSPLRDLLTRREIDVLDLMVRGETNGGIARALVISEGTVKFHVKNILRKLHAANRAEATSRYLRLTLGHRTPGQ